MTGVSRVQRSLTVCSVERFECPTCLVEKVLAVIVAQVLCPNDSVEVRLEEFLYEIHWSQRGQSCSPPSLKLSYDTGLIMSSTVMIWGQQCPIGFSHSR